MSSPKSRVVKRLVIVESEVTDTLVPGRTTLGTIGELPDSSVKLTVAPVTNPVPLIAIAVPPAVEPELRLYATKPVTEWEQPTAYVPTLLTPFAFT